MALSRRTGQRFQGSIWPGFVDAMSGLLLVLFFVLSIFMVVQFTLSETITGQETELDELAGEVAALAQALGLQEQSNTVLEARVGTLTATLENSEARIAALTAERDRVAADLAQAETQITSFEDQVAALASERDGALAQVGDLETAQSELLSEQEALNLALAQARSEVDATAEVARLAAARREALEALVADLETRAGSAEAALENQRQVLETTQDALSAEEAARLTEAAAAQALRDRLANADTELTAMTLSLEAQRQKAEDTLTLLAAAQTAQADLDDQLMAAFLQIQTLEAAQSSTRETAQSAQTRVATLEAETADLNEKLLTALTTIQRLEAAQSSTSLSATQAQERIVVLEVALSQAAEQAGELTAERDRLQADLARLTANTETVAVDRDALRQQLAQAIAAKLAAEEQADAKQSDADWRAALLATAQQSLADEKQVSLAAQRQTALLNQQVAALRAQLGELQGLLDAARSADVAKDVQLQSLGSELNTALARVAAEERRRRQLEEDERKRLEAEAIDLQKYRSEFFGQLRDLLGTQEGVQIVGDRFVFSSEVLFAQGAANLSLAGQREIAKIATILREVADDIPAGIDWVLQVDGHTDNVPLSGNGAFADNWQLSQARALSVVRYMVNFLGLPPERLSANGFGQYQPINPENTPEARAQNRRIEIKFTEK